MINLILKMRINKYNNPEKKNQKGIIKKLNIENSKHNILYSENIIQNNYNINYSKNPSKDKNNDFLSSDEGNIKNIIFQSNKKKGKFNNNDNNVKKDLSYISSDEITKSKNKGRNKKTPQIIYNKILQRSPIKKGIKEYKKNNNKKNIYLFNSPSSPYLLPRDNSFKLCPQKEINLEYIQQDIYNFNNNYYNKNNFYKINNTQNQFYLERAKKKENNFFHDIKYLNKRGISPEYNNNLITSSLNDNESNGYNKTMNNFYRNKRFIKSNNIEISNNRIISDNINKYNNHKVTEIVYTNNYNNNKFNNQSNNYFSSLTQENNELSDIYEDKSNNYKINYINNSSEKKNIIRIFKNKKLNKNLKYNYNEEDEDDENIIQKQHIKKNNSLFMNDIIPYDPYHYKKNNSRNRNAHNNNNLTEILDTKKIENLISYPKPFNSNYKFVKADYNNNDENVYKILVKKRPLKEKSNSNNILSEYSKLNHKLKQKENKLIIWNNNSFYYENSETNKLIFENEDKIIEYINKKFEEEKQKTYFNRKIKFTGFVLTKKYKGKTLYDIRIENDIDKINNKLKEENVSVNNELIQICPYNKLSKNSLEKEILKYKEENELLCKKDIMKNELIKKLDKEKQNIIEENKKILNELEKMKLLNSNINEQYQKLKVNNIKLKNNEIESNISITIRNNNEKIKEIFDNKKLKEEKIEINYISKNSDNSNILSYGDGNESKKNNINIFRLSKISKISEIKENKMDNDNDSKDTTIKNNIALLNEKLNKNNNNNEEYFHENNKE